MTAAMAQPAAPKRKAKAPAAAVDAAEFQHDAIAIRTVDLKDQAHNGFQWPTEIGMVVDCPDWSAQAKCGNGFHALLDGIGDWILTFRSEGMIWQVVGVIRDEFVAVGDDKVKFPRCRLLYRGDKAGALRLVVPAMVAAIGKRADGKIATGDRGHAAATGDRGVAVSLGYDGTATAGPTGWIVLAYCSRQHPYAVERVERFKVGDGVEAGKTYRLSADGQPVEVL